MLSLCFSFLMQWLWRLNGCCNNDTMFRTMMMMMMISCPSVQTEEEEWWWWWWWCWWKATSSPTHPMHRTAFEWRRVCQLYHVTMLLHLRVPCYHVTLLQGNTSGGTKMAKVKLAPIWWGGTFYRDKSEIKQNNIKKDLDGWNFKDSTTKSITYLTRRYPKFSWQFEKKSCRWWLLVWST